jgi:hypothetical protein
MTTENAFIFSWDQYGIESIVPISQYEILDQENTIRLLKGEPIVKNPFNQILNALLMRARTNSHRHYEIYSIDCTMEMDVVYWTAQWKLFPQATAELIRSRGQSIFSQRASGG